MLLVEQGNDLSDPEIRSWESDFRDMEIAETFNESFVNIVSRYREW